MNGATINIAPSRHHCPVHKQSGKNGPGFIFFKTQVDSPAGSGCFMVLVAIVIGGHDWGTQIVQTIKVEKKMQRKFLADDKGILAVKEKCHYVSEK